MKGGENTMPSFNSGSATAPAPDKKRRKPKEMKTPAKKQ